MVGRVVVGVGIGISASVVPAYLGEVAPARGEGGRRLGLTLVHHVQGQKGNAAPQLWSKLAAAAAAATLAAQVGFPPVPSDTLHAPPACPAPLPLPRRSPWACGGVF